MTRHDYQDMSAGYEAPKGVFESYADGTARQVGWVGRLATPSGTGEAVQPCVNCTSPVAWVKVGITGSPGAEYLWLHTPSNNRLCAS